VRSRRSPMSKKAAARARDFLLYVLIGVVIALGVLWYAEHSDATGAESIGRWGGLTLNTLILYGYVINGSREFWRAWGFWLAATSVLILHLFVFAVIFQHTDHWSVGWFLLMYPIELPVLMITCDWAVHITGGQPRGSDHSLDHSDQKFGGESQ
jgi:hypothetical protein